MQLGGLILILLIPFIYLVESGLLDSRGIVIYISSSWIFINTVYLGIELYQHGDKHMRSGLLIWTRPLVIHLSAKIFKYTTKKKLSYSKGNLFYSLLGGLITTLLMTAFLFIIFFLFYPESGLLR